MKINRLRRNLYRAAADLGDLEAASHGPVPYAKRRVRRAAYRHTGRGLRRLLRLFGLSR